MLKYYNYDIVCQEIPDEITLAINITGCPNHCLGCHSPWLWKDIGEPLNKKSMHSIIDKYASDITCICFMDGDQMPKEIEQLAELVRTTWPSLKTAWYSGRNKLPDGFGYALFNFVKTGPYIESLGGLRSSKTNQRLYKISSEGLLQKIIFHT